MDSTLVQIYARELLGLTLTESEAEALVGPLAGLRKLVEQIETVPMPYTSEPFISPRCGDEWLERWPER